MKRPALTYYIITAKTQDYLHQLLHSNAIHIDPCEQFVNGLSVYNWKSIRFSVTASRTRALYSP